jgi:hypothetical protein
MRSLSVLGVLACLSITAMWTHGCYTPPPPLGSLDGGSDSGVMQGACGPFGNGLEVVSIADLHKGAPETYGNPYEVDCAVVVAAIASYLPDGGVKEWQIYIQDQGGGPQTGVEVFLQPPKGDVAPASISEGDIVSVVGTLTVTELSFASESNGRVEMAFSSANSSTGAGLYEVKSGGTVPPSISLASTDLDPMATTALQYVGQKVKCCSDIPDLQAIDGFNPSWGTSPYGFTVTDGVWINDDFTYNLDNYACGLGYNLRHSATDGGTQTPIALPGGIVGIWDTWRTQAGALTHAIYPWRCNQILMGSE